VAEGKRWKLVLDGGIRWNATYMMIRRALELKEALNAYCVKLRVSKEDLDQETFLQDYLTDDEWTALEIIRDQLEPLFRLTNDLEGNASIRDDKAGGASHGAIWELLLAFEFILGHFERLETEAKEGAFSDHPGIQESITLAWGIATFWYNKTDHSIAWLASVVLHPRFKWTWFERK
jgi:hypothetical protein